jgi:Uri superfamily endonuclease
VASTQALTRTLVNAMKGIYVLLIHLNRDIAIRVGSLGTREFKEGNYVYVGSAQNGVEQRVARHLRKEKRLFWHIDYLLNDDAAEIVEVYVKPAGKEEECQVAAKISEKAEPVTGFGCSDCHCPSHLFQLTLRGFKELLHMEGVERFRKLE